MIPRRTAWGLAAGSVFMLSLACGAEAQQSVTFGLSGYALNVGSAAGESPFSSGGFSDFQRLREMLEVSSGRFRLDIAYEQALLLAESPGGTTSGLLPANPANNWWDMEWTIDDGDHHSVAHRIDRAAVTFLAGPLEATVGRQVVSWASTLFLTPADPFTPFDPTDPFREFRAGIDALRIRWYPGPFSDIDVVVRPTRGADGDQLTALVRAKTNWRGWDLSAWGGALFDRGAAAAQLVGSLGSWAVRSEVSVRDEEDGNILRTTLGVDRRLRVADRDMYLVVEYQHDGFGAGDGELLAVLSSTPARRGELQVFSRNALATQASLEVNPLVNVDLLALWSLTDGSVLLGPGLTWSASSSATLRLGGFLGAGAESAGTLESEFGDTPAVAYLSASLYF